MRPTLVALASHKWCCLRVDSGGSVRWGPLRVGEHGPGRCHPGIGGSGDRSPAADQSDPLRGHHQRRGCRRSCRSREFGRPAGSNNLNKRAPVTLGAADLSPSNDNTTIFVIVGGSDSLLSLSSLSGLSGGPPRGDLYASTWWAAREHTRGIVRLSPTPFLWTERCLPSPGTRLSFLRRVRSTPHSPNTGLRRVR